MTISPLRRSPGIRLLLSCCCLLACSSPTGETSSDEDDDNLGGASSTANSLASGDAGTATTQAVAGAQGEAAAGGGGDSAPLFPDGEMLVALEDSEKDNTGGTEECARDVYTGDPIDVGIYLLMDVSGSMRGPVELETVEGILGMTVWDAVSGAAQDFFASEESSGFDVAINTFPKQADARTCEPGAPCVYAEGTPDEVRLSCVTDVCAAELYLGGVVAGCSRNAQCVDTCGIPGHCSDDPTRVCGDDAHCAEGQFCDYDTVIGTCERLLSCDIDDYRAPLLDRGPLPDNAEVAIELLRSLSPDGQGATPTHYGLVGAYETVDQWRLDDPQSRGVVVLLTDGDPNGCASSLTDDCGPETACGLTLSVMTQAREVGIPTFVLGVITPVTDAGDTLQAMAEAGGTEEAFLVTVDDSASANLLQALNAIRGTAVPCEFALPTPDEGDLDPNFVNVELSGVSGEPTTLPRVASVAQCAAAGAGWYYTTDATGEYSGLKLCQDSCTEVRNGNNGLQVDIVLGCPQVVTIF